MNLAENLLDLEEELNSGSYRPSRSVCFVNLRPKPREIFAADFRDRVVHHLFIRTIEPYWERVFIHDSYACRPGKGTHAAVDRLEQFVRSATRGGRQRACFLQFDVHNFFMSIDRRILFDLIDRGLQHQYGIPKGKLPLFCTDLGRYQDMRTLAQTLIFHDPTENFARKSSPETWRHIADHKSLFHCQKNRGLPIGNLTSQFFGNVYLNLLDQFVKHNLKAGHYIRYVDDAILLHEDRDTLLSWKESIEAFLGERLLLKLNEGATRLKPVSCGINFLGYVVHPDHRLVRRRVVGNLRTRLDEFRTVLVTEDKDTGVRTCRFNPDVLENLLATLNSYLAHLAKACSHHLVEALLQEHPWLNEYFRFDGYRAERRWRPPVSFRGCQDQWRWFRHRWPRTVIFFQVGRYHELYGRDALWATHSMGLTPRDPRFRKVARVGVPTRLLNGCMKRTLAKGRSVLSVTETEYPLYSLKERLPNVFLHQQGKP